VKLNLQYFAFITHTNRELSLEIMVKRRPLITLTSVLVRLLVFDNASQKEDNDWGRNVWSMKRRASGPEVGQRGHGLEVAQKVCQVR